MNASFAEAVNLLLAYRYLILFPIALVEGPTITIVAGFVASLGFLNIWIALATVVVADLVADAFYYAVGRYGGIRFVNKWGHYVGINTERVNTLKKHFHNNAGKTLFLGKVTLFIGMAFLVAAGLTKYPFKKFMWISSLATVSKSFVLILIGYYFGHTYSHITKYLDFVVIASTTIAIILVIAYIISKKFEEKATNN